MKLLYFFTLRRFLSEPTNHFEAIKVGGHQVRFFYYKLSKTNHAVLLDHRCHKLSVRESQQNYKDLYDDPVKRPEKIILRNYSQLKSPALLPLWLPSCVVFVIPGDVTKQRQTKIHYQATNKNL